MFFGYKKVVNWTLKNQVENSHDPLLPNSQPCFHSFFMGRKKYFSVVSSIIFKKVKTNVSVCNLSSNYFPGYNDFQSLENTVTLSHIETTKP